MKTSFRLVLVLVASLMVLSLIAGASFTQDSPDLEKQLAFSDPNALVGSDVSEVEQLSTSEFWTDEMIANAKPLPLPVSSGVESLGLERADEAFRGSPGSFPSQMPDSDIMAEAMANLDMATLAEEYPALDTEDYFGFGVDEPLADGYDYPPPFTRYPGNSDWRTHRFFPYTTVGKIFFSIPNTSGTYSCSGAVGNQRVVWTAGHCVYTPGKGWHTNMIFIPAYKNYGNLREIYGRFTVTSKQTLAGWTGGKSAYDIAMMRVADKSGKKIYQYTGYLGFKYNQSSKQHWHAIGYPGNFHDGRFTHICTASLSRRDSKTGPDPIGIGCDMQHGSSGGPWILSFRPYVSGANNYVNSVVSYGKTGKTQEFYGPYFTTGAKNLWDWGRAQ